jgi:short-subunit dehydrogenase
MVGADAGTGGWGSTGGKADIVVCDLANKEDVGGLIKKVTGDGRVLDIVVNCGMYALCLRLLYTSRAPTRI